MSTVSPPELEGHEFERLLGRGGFADVFLFRQALPSRPVAIKVLRDRLRTDEDRVRFENEVNRMAMLSSHPGIVTIYGVGTAPDGRSWLSMEFCPRGHLGAAVAERPSTVARALEVGVKVAAAVETAHRAGVLHRDVKPANVLLTEFGEPALTDFGIAGGIGVASGTTSAGGAAGSLEEEIAHGVSIPFAAPEVNRGDSMGDETADVYGLGATVYALLAGRSPFHDPADPGTAALLRRVLAGSPPPTGRDDVPESLEHVLATALQRDPADRYESAGAFGRALQQVQGELGLERTPMSVAERGVSKPVHRDPDDPDGTRFRSAEVVDPTGASGRSGWGSSPVLSAEDLGSRTIRRDRRTDEPDGADRDDADAAEQPDPGLRRRRLVGSGIAAVLVAAALVLLVLRVGARDDADSVSTTTVPPAGDLVAGGAPRPERVRIEPDDPSGQLVTWSVAGGAEGDSFRVTITDGPAARRGEAAVVEEREWRIDTDRRVCVVVETLRGAKVSESSREVCSR